MKNLPAMQETWVRPWVGKISWRRERLPTPVFWPGGFHGLYSTWGRKSQTQLSNFHFHLITSKGLTEINNNPQKTLKCVGDWLLKVLNFFFTHPRIHASHSKILNNKWVGGPHPFGLAWPLVLGSKLWQRRQWASAKPRSFCKVSLSLWTPASSVRTTLQDDRWQSRAECTQVSPFYTTQLPASRLRVSPANPD